MSEVNNKNRDKNYWSREPVFIEDFDPLLTFKDLRGILPVLKKCSIKTIEMMPVFEHCNSGDKGYRWMVRDYFKLDPARGSKADLKDFLDEAHRLGLKVVTMIHPESAGIPNFYPKSPIAKIAYDKEGKGGYAYIYQLEHPDKKVLLKNSDGEFVCHPMGWGYAVDCSSEDVIALWEDIFKNITKLGFDGIRLDACDKNYCHKGDNIYTGCSGYPCPDPVDGEYPSMDLYRRLKKLKRPDQAFFAENSSLMEHHTKWPCDFPYYNSHPDFDEVAEVCEDYSFTPVLIRIIFSSGLSKNNELKDLLFKTIRPTEEKISSEDLTKWVNTEYKEHVLCNGERFHFIRNWNYFQYELLKFIATDFRYIPAVTLVCTICGIPKVSYYELFGFPMELQLFLGAEVTPEKRKSHWKKVLVIRSNSNALKYGSMSNVWKSGDETYAYLRKYQDEKVIVVINFSDKKVNSYLDLSPIKKGVLLSDELNKEKFVIDKLEDFKISVSPYGSRIMIVE